MSYYHYTSLSKFKKIYDSRLKMSRTNNVRKDGNESSVIHHMLATLQSSDPEVFKSLAKTLSVNENIDAIFEKLNCYRSSTYILCLSETATNEHLWKYYAEENSGVVIQLRDEFLPAKIPFISGKITRGNHERHAEISLFTMIYGYNEYKNYLASILSQKNPVLPSLYILMDLVKDETHQDEKETRMLYYLGENANVNSTFQEIVNPEKGDIQIILRRNQENINIIYTKNESQIEELNILRSFAAIICKNKNTIEEILELLNLQKQPQIKDNQYIFELDS